MTCHTLPLQHIGTHTYTFYQSVTNCLQSITSKERERDVKCDKTLKSGNSTANDTQLYKYWLKGIVTEFQTRLLLLFSIVFLPDLFPDLSLYLSRFRSLRQRLSNGEAWYNVLPNFKDVRFEKETYSRLFAQRSEWHLVKYIIKSLTWQTESTWNASGICHFWNQLNYF